MGLEQQRCHWPGTDRLYLSYHDTEWGVPEFDSRALYEKLVLDGFQAGLSWITILRKRENFRKAFHGFDPHRIARYGSRDIDRLLKDEGIIRSRAKIAATIAGARIFLAMEKDGGFAEAMWAHVDGKPVRGTGHLVAKTPLSEAISADLRKRGFKFVGPVIVYAWMQAVGMVNDHAPECFRCLPHGRTRRGREQLGSLPLVAHTHLCG
jgi:DNA-3-methyladenine glycosylase I